MHVDQRLQAARFRLCLTRHLEYLVFREVMWGSASIFGMFVTAVVMIGHRKHPQIAVGTHKHDPAFTACERHQSHNIAGVIIKKCRCIDMLEITQCLGAP